MAFLTPFGLPVAVWEWMCYCVWMENQRLLDETSPDRGTFDDLYNGKGLVLVRKVPMRCYKCSSVINMYVYRTRLPVSGFIGSVYVVTHRVFEFMHVWCCRVYKLHWHVTDPVYRFHQDRTWL